MAATYTSPSSSTRDAVRFLCGDTNTASAYLQDEEIDFLLAENPNKYRAAAEACDAIAAKLRRNVDKSIGSMHAQTSQRAAGFERQATILRTKANRRSTGVFFGSEMRADKESLDADTEAMQPSFKLGQDDLPSLAIGGEPE